eukprot:720256_1
MDTDYDDLKQNYDALYDKLRTAELENQLYEKEIQKLNQEIMTLKEQNTFIRRESVEFKRVTSPIFTSSIQCLSTALEDADEDRENIMDQNDEYKHQIKELTQQIDELKEQVTTYQHTLEMLQNNKTQQALEHAHYVDALHQRIEDMKREKSDMMFVLTDKSERYETLKVELETQLQTQMEVTSPVPPDDMELEDKWIRLRFMNSNIAPQLTDKNHSQTAGMRYIQYTSAESLPGLMDDETWHSNAVNHDDAKSDREFKENGVLLSRMSNEIKSKHVQMNAMCVQIEILKRENVKLRKLVQNQA